MTESVTHDHPKWDGHTYISFSWKVVYICILHEKIQKFMNKSALQHNESNCHFYVYIYVISTDTGIYSHANTHTHTHTHTHTLIHTQTHIHIYIYIFIYMKNKILRCILYMKFDNILVYETIFKVYNWC